MWYRAVGCFVTLALSLLVVPLTAETQPAGQVARIGFLSPGTATAANSGLLQAFTDGLRHHGWIEGQNLAIEYCWEGAGTSTFDALAAELAQLPLDAILALNTPAALALKRTGTSLPVVFAIVSDPVEIGLVESLARPGRNFTGLTTMNRELMAKRLEVLKETLPGLSRVGYLANPGYAVHAAHAGRPATRTRVQCRVGHRPSSTLCGLRVVCDGQAFPQ
jgi:putative ABC transport system substrate-binding protein